jgi:hypothetical protein
VLYPLVGRSACTPWCRKPRRRAITSAQCRPGASASYTHHYRRIPPLLLDVLAFRSNNEQHRPLLEALTVVTCLPAGERSFYPEDQEVPLEDVIQKQWQSWIYQRDNTLAAHSPCSL